MQPPSVSAPPQVLAPLAFSQIMVVRYRVYHDHGEQSNGPCPSEYVQPDFF
jgi:hypothetical protein